MSECQHDELYSHKDGTYHCDACDGQFSLVPAEAPNMKRNADAPILGDAESHESCVVVCPAEGCGLWQPGEWLGKGDAALGRFNECSKCGQRFHLG